MHSDPLTLDHFEETCATIAWDVEHVQVGRGTAAIGHDIVHLGDVVVRRLSLSHALLHEFRIEEGWTTLVLVSATRGPGVWNGRHSPLHGIGLLLPGRDHVATTPAGWSVIEVDVRIETVLEEVLASKTYEWASRHENPVLQLEPSVAAEAAVLLERRAFGREAPHRSAVLEILRWAIGRSSALDPPPGRAQTDVLAR
ncbi:MAG: hypothetical protein AAF602_27500, partial [Myxococcota bacterium]